MSLSIKVCGVAIYTATKTAYRGVIVQHGLEWT